MKTFDFSSADYDGMTNNAKCLYLISIVLCDLFSYARRVCRINECIQRKATTRAPASMNDNILFIDRKQMFESKGINMLAS